MTISFVGFAAAAANDGADVVVDLTDIAGLAEDDLVIVVYGIGDNDNVDQTMAIVSPSGYTKEADLFADDTREANLGAFTKIMGVTPDTSVTCDGLGGSDAQAAAIAMAFRGVDTTTPMDVAVTTTEVLNTMYPNPASINFDDAGCAVVIGSASAHRQGQLTAVFPTGYTTNPHEITNEDPGDDTDITICMGYNLSPSDPEDPGSIGMTGVTDFTSHSNCTVTLALRPAAAAAGGLTSGSLSLMGVGI